MIPLLIRQVITLAHLAQTREFDKETVWNEPKNETLRQLRKENILYPGDVIHIPEPTREWRALQPGTTNTYRAFSWPMPLPITTFTPWDAVYFFYDPARTQYWKIGCAWFVQIAHLRAQAMTLGYTAFNYRIGNPFLFRSHRSSGMKTTALYRRIIDHDYDPDAKPPYVPQPEMCWNDIPTLVVKNMTPAQILERAPAGSRICFHNPACECEDSLDPDCPKLNRAFMNEIRSN